MSTSKLRGNERRGTIGTIGTDRHHRHYVAGPVQFASSLWLEPPEHGFPEGAVAALLHCLGVPPRRRHLELRWLKRNPPHSFGRSLSLPSLLLFFGMFATPIIGGTCLFSLRQPAVAAYWGGGRVLLLWALLV
ncbi:uncharacterized protein LOC117283099 [Cryptotermes secundus]|uniref:uncharacterized protein LOC117283099 n=1 Tax=Cryptotermes secundus TaxID=105785 RepID=UPI001454BC5D|nr:uncharacterized protein LOC117283099 [Cryptotermes secundus]